MSMLAEPRRKQKWSVDPRNSAWSNDDSKFGQKMLERMGWSKGKGLGRTQQGSTEHVKVKVKNDSYGLGANASHEDKWIAHQDDFNELLAQLNNCHGQNNNETPPDESKGFSLEEKSKTSRKRVHYMKFTKGKDLSSRSETDLNCIFGKRARLTKEEQGGSSGDSSHCDTEQNITTAPTELDTESIANTVTSTLTMQEYFAQRMSQLKKAGGAESTAAANTETSEPSDDRSPTNRHDDTEEPKKKKKKKMEKRSEEVEEMSSPDIVDQVKHEQEPLKKKRKTDKNDSEVTENSSLVSGVEQNCDGLPSAKKKKLKKLSPDSMLQNGLDETENQGGDLEVAQKKKKKKKRSKEEVDIVVMEDREETIQKKSKKKKKKRD